MEKLKETLLKAATEAGYLVHKYFRTEFGIDHKDGINNLVTEVDKKSEKMIREIIHNNFPQHTIIGEEFEKEPGNSDIKWVIDPIDGTTNFAHGLPICCISIAVLKDDETIMGCVYNPMMNEFFVAEKNKGAFLNDRRIRVSENSDFKRAFIVTGFPYHFPNGKGDITKPFSDLVALGLPVRRLGAAALDLCWVAAGRFDGFFEYNLQPWDVAAGYLILEEAGGKITNFQGTPTSIWDGETLATNGKIHAELRSVICDDYRLSK